ncbi:hypothetical protein Hanom_Chr09g00783031 [Helianthus anomalus]
MKRGRGWSAVVVGCAMCEGVCLISVYILICCKDGKNRREEMMLQYLMWVCSSSIEMERKVGLFVCVIIVCRQRGCDCSQGYDGIYKCWFIHLSTSSCIESLS